MQAAPIVVGAGPVGLCAALRIVQCGAPVIVLEKRDRLSSASKASTLHPPTLEILHALGVWTPGGGGEIVDRVQFRERDAGVVAEFALSALAGETSFPYRLHLEQAEITPLLLDALRRSGRAEIHFDATFEGLEDTREGVNARVRVAGETHVLHGSCVVGADGAHSAVRAAMGADFEGAAYANRVVRLMTRAPLEEHLPELAPLTYLFAPAGSASLLKMPDCWRIILRGATGLSDAEAANAARCKAEVADYVSMPSCALDDLRADVFGVEKRVASVFARSRAFLIGDAAHITNTRGGMNMNCGVHDAWALGARLAEAWRSGDFEPAHAIAQERRRVASEVLIPRTDSRVSGAREWLAQVRALAADKEASLVYLRETCMLDMAERPAL
jgi:2-polyprenyl-6-methoxyphenol hydroxylase-like FAD-dependent oxidoreductase